MAAVAREQRATNYELGIKNYELREKLQNWKLLENEHLPGRNVDT
jgi:hypothetical protein